MAEKFEVFDRCQAELQSVVATEDNVASLLMIAQSLPDLQANLMPNSCDEMLAGLFAKVVGLFDHLQSAGCNEPHNLMKLLTETASLLPMEGQLPPRLDKCAEMVKQHGSICLQMKLEKQARDIIALAKGDVHEFSASCQSMAALLSQCTYSAKLASNAEFQGLFNDLVKVLLHSLGGHLTSKYVEYMSAGLEVCKTMDKPFVGGSEDDIMEWEMSKAVDVQRALMQAEQKNPEAQEDQPDGMKEASELKKKLLDKSKASLDSARSLLEATAGGQPAGAHWLDSFAGTDWASLQKHADNTLLKMDGELLATSMLATMKASSSSWPKAMFPTLYCQAYDFFKVVHSNLDEVLDEEYVVSIEALLMKARTTKCSGVMFHLFGVEHDKTKLRASLQGEVKLLRAVNTLEKNVLHEFLYSRLMLALSMRSVMNKNTSRLCNKDGGQRHGPSSRVEDLHSGLAT
eukprot:6475518-Amphidinium_carterae.2